MNLEPDTTTQHDAASPGGTPASQGQAASYAATLLRVLRAVIAVGVARLRTLQVRPEPAEISPLAIAFGTFNLAAIIARITRGLRLAGLLEDRIGKTATRIDARRANPSPKPASTKPRTTPRAPRKPVLSDADDTAALLARMPTEAEIAEMVRRRPIGAVLADICRDVGIGTDHPLWHELRWFIVENNSNWAAALKRTFQRIFDAHEEARAMGPPLHDAPPMVAATGPPLLRQAA
jgi:hypothetical protein